jgi:hypothetical protein
MVYLIRSYFAKSVKHLFPAILFWLVIINARPSISFAVINCGDVPGYVRYDTGSCPGPGLFGRTCNVAGGERCVSCSDPADPLKLPTMFACQGISVIPDNISTEIGKISAKPEKLVEAFSRILIYLAGGVSLFLLLSGAIKYLFSTGNPDNIEEAKGIITHALGGFLLVFLSVFLLRFMGVDVLHIPGLELSPGGGVGIPYTP